MKHQKYKDFGNVSAGRLFINKELMPRFASHFPDGSEILFIGVHKYWDYACYFHNPGKLCNFTTLDYHPGSEKDEQPAPDLCMNIQDGDNLKDNSYDGIIMIGVYEYLSDRPKVFSTLNRILKPGGASLISVPGRGYNTYEQYQENSMSIEEVWKAFTPLLPVEVYVTYEKENEPTSIHIICKKGK